MIQGERQARRQNGRGIGASALDWVCVHLMLLGLLATLGPRANAQETVPGIADLRVDTSIIVLDLHLNAEALLAGLDPSDPGAMTGGAEYARLRALPPEALAPMFRDFATVWVAQLGLEAGRKLALNVGRIDVPPVGDEAIARATRIVLTAPLPAGADALSLTWPEGAGDLVVRQQGVAEPFTAYLTGGQTTAPIAIDGGATQPTGQVLRDYIWLGVVQILQNGGDHVLFVLALVFLNSRLPALLWQFSAFAMGHTLAMALGVIGAVDVSPELVGLLVSVSVVYVALENIVTGTLHRWRVFMVFGFGLFHGLALAAALEQIGLPPGRGLAALTGFSIGVDLGLLGAIALALLLGGAWLASRPWYRGRIAIPASVVIAMIGAYWVVQRVI